jgi:hypothetical protein
MEDHNEEDRFFYADGPNLVGVPVLNKMKLGPCKKMSESTEAQSSYYRASASLSECWPGAAGLGVSATWQRD